MSHDHAISQPLLDTRSLLAEPSCSADRAAQSHEPLLWDAEYHVTLADWRIFCQFERIERMRSEGASTRAAEEGLRALKLGRDAWDARRLEILSTIHLVTAMSTAA
jgi:hypothetical protein